MGNQASLDKYIGTIGLNKIIINPNIKIVVFNNFVVLYD
jgi:hypothetical protein